MPKKSLVIKEIPTAKNDRHPEPPNELLPKHEFSLGIVAPKGSGKTNLMLNLLRFYKGYFHSIFVFSPSVETDSKWDIIKEEKMLSENLRLKKALKIIAERRKRKKNQVVEPPPDDVDNSEFFGMAVVEGEKPPHKDEFDGLIPEEHFFPEYTHEAVAAILDEQLKMIRFLKGHGFSKADANRILIVFDDLVGSEAYSAARDNPYKKLSANHRQYSASTISIVQAYKEIMKTARTQLSGLILFRTFNEKELAVIREEYPMGMDPKSWCEVYQYCTENPFDFLYYNIRGKIREAAVMRNFDEFIVTEQKDLDF